MEAEIRGIAERLTENEPEIKGSVSFGCEGKATTYSGSNKRARLSLPRGVRLLFSGDNFDRSNIEEQYQMVLTPDS